MEFRELLPRRRMVRHYGPEPVSAEQVERIVATVRRAPSAGYSQGQRLLVVTEESGRAEVARIMGDAGWTATDGREPWLESAPVHVLVCTREGDYHDRYLQPDKLQDGEELDWPVPFWFVDAGAALMLLLLAAIDEGLAAGLSGVPRDAMARAALVLRDTRGGGRRRARDDGSRSSRPRLECGHEPAHPASARTGRGRPLAALGLTRS